MNVIMILTNGFEPDVRVYKEAKYLVNKGNVVEILCWDREGKYQGKEKEVFDGVKITRFYEKSTYGSGLKQVFKLLKFKKACKKYIKENKINYDIMHCHDLDGMIVGYMICQKKDKLVFDMHEYYNTGGYSKIYPLVQIMLKFLQNKAYKIIHVNQRQIEKINSKNQCKLVYLPNYPEMNCFNHIQHEDSNELRITYAGNVRHLIPLTSLAQAANELNDINVSIYGDGTAYEQVKCLEKEYKNINVHGKFMHDEIAKFYEKSDLIYIVYNKGDENDENALPTKFFEAIASNIPVIVSKNSLLEDTVKKYDIGFSVDGTDYHDVKAVLEKIQNDKQLLTQKVENIKQIPEKFSWEEVVKNLDEIYKGEET